MPQNSAILDEFLVNCSYITLIHTIMQHSKNVVSKIHHYITQGNPSCFSRSLKIKGAFNTHFRSV